MAKLFAEDSAIVLGQLQCRIYTFAHIQQPS
jgi:hypothetical protein